MRRMTLRLGALSLAALLAGCAGPNTPAPTAPAHASAPTPPPAAALATSAATSARAASPDAPRQGFFRNRQRDARQRDPFLSAPGVTVINGSGDAEGATRRRVDPAAISLASLPVARIPAALLARDAPPSLPVGKQETRLAIEDVQQGWRANRPDGGAAYVKVDAPLGRLQIGSIGFDRSAGSRVYRTCGMQRHTHATLAPARWSVLERDSTGHVIYRLFDGWFDSQTCTGSVVRETVIHPTPLVGGLLYAFRSPCEDAHEDDASTPQAANLRLGKMFAIPANHRVTGSKATCQGEIVTVLSPALSNVGASGIGSPARTSHGTFTIAQLPIMHGGAASFTGELASHTLASWFASLAVPTRATSDALKRSTAVVGVEIAHTVSDPEPLAIAYASIVRR
jgi:hypothetical protein